MKQVLLHCCCAPCSSAIIEWMLANGVRPMNALLIKPLVCVESIVSPHAHNEIRFSVPITLLFARKLQKKLLISQNSSMFAQIICYIMYG